MIFSPKNYIFPKIHADFLNQFHIKIPTSTAVLVISGGHRQWQAYDVSCPRECNVETEAGF